MNGEIIDDEELDDMTEDIDLDDDDIDNVGDISVEINVEELVAKIQADDDDAAARKKEIHRRLEEINERRAVEREIDNTFNFNLDDDF
jgi:hypothetical protein